MTVRAGVARTEVLVSWTDDPGLTADALLGELLGREVRTARVCPRCGSDRHGRPVVVGPGAAGCWVSIARAGPVTVVALSTCGPVGVDVEPDHAHGPPATVVHHAAERDQTEVLRTWVRKESLLKATGHGLAVDPAEVRLSPPGTAPELLTWDAPQAPPSGPVRISDVDGPPGHVTALSLLTERRPVVEVRQAAPAGRAPRATS